MCVRIRGKKCYFFGKPLEAEPPAPTWYDIVYRIAYIN